MAACHHLWVVALFVAVQMCCLPGLQAEPGVVIVNRDVEGATLTDDAVYTPSATECQQLCQNTTGCNLWVWCGNAVGCSSGSNTQDLRSYRQCWMKYDRPKQGGFPRTKGTRDQQVGWLSGTTESVEDTAGVDETWSGCRCKDEYTVGIMKFKGVCTNYDSSGTKCQQSYTGCRYTPSSNPEGCTDIQRCRAQLDTDLDGAILPGGEGDWLYANSAEECCGKCRSKEGCNIWVWCSQPQGCGGDMWRFRQCWLKQGTNPLNATAKAGDTSGWMSGTLTAYIQ